MDKPLVQSIEFEEPYDQIDAETISAKHTVIDFNEEETTRTAQQMNLPSPPKRMAVTIRQTMTKQGLSTREPLRILYVGSHSAKQDIIHKIASSVTASVDGWKSGHSSRISPSQLYNVVPVSAFGSEKTPEIELMHSSGYQIKVEDCIMGQSLKFEDVPEKPDVIKLDLEDHFSYHSVPDGEGFIVEPAWELPHIAVTYCSDTDDLEARRTLSLARKFMSRHGVPCIVISHKQLFHRGVSMSLDQHSIHMCLESRDPRGRGSIIHRRLPIDLASFLNIDARQMNRNLAYLTGLHESLESPTASSTLKRAECTRGNPRDLEKSSYSLGDSISFVRNRSAAEWRALIPVGLLFLSVLTAVLTGLPSYRFSTNPAISVNSKVMSAVPMSTSSLVAPPPVASITSTSTSTVVNTSTKTVTVTHAQSPGPNSLAVVPSTEVGKLFHTVQNKPANKSSICTAEILGVREILIRIPSATMLSWLNKEALSVNITRGNASVDTERAYSTDDGVVLLLARNQAYGVLNISIITTKKPRVNETFQVDFGSNFWQTFAEKYSSIAVDLEATYERSFAVMTKLANDARVRSQIALGNMGAVKKVAAEQASLATTRVAEMANLIAQEATKRTTVISKEVTTQLNEAESKLLEYSESIEALRQPLARGLLKAQVQSKLLWLKIQSKHEEHARYRAAARAHAALAKTACKGKSSRAIKKATRKAEKAAKRDSARRERKYGRKVRT